jgi:long-subunit acyl-CoA synthetase (AMP-forming)
VVIPDEKAIRALVEAKNLGNKNQDLEKLNQIRGVKDAVLSDMLKAGKSAGLQGIQLVSGIVLVPDTWTPDNVKQFKTMLKLGACHSCNEVDPSQYSETLRQGD